MKDLPSPANSICVNVDWCGDSARREGLDEEEDGGVGTALRLEWRNEGRIDWIRAGVALYIRSERGVRRRYLGGMPDGSS